MSPRYLELTIAVLPFVVALPLRAQVQRSPAYQRDSAYLAFQSIPNGPASAFVDGVRVGDLGQAELTVRVALGARKIKVQKFGFADFDTVVVLTRRNDVLPVQIVLVPARATVLREEASGTARQKLFPVRIAHIDPAIVTIAGDGFETRTPAVLGLPAGRILLKVGSSELCLDVPASPSDTGFVLLKAGRVNDSRLVAVCTERPSAQSKSDDQSPADLAEAARQARIRSSAEIEATLVGTVTVDSRSCGLNEAGTLFCLRPSAQAEDGGLLLYQRMPYGGPLREVVIDSTSSLPGDIACATGDAPAMFCWGRFRPGLGTPLQTLAEYTVHRPLSADAPYLHLPAVAALHRLSLSSLLVCGLDGNAVVHCAGSNIDGALGRGDTKIRRDSVASPVRGGLRARLVIVKNTTACAHGTDSKVYCWGSKDFAGDVEGATPRPISNGAEFKALRFAKGRFCALPANGSEICWGGYATR